MDIVCLGKNDGHQGRGGGKSLQKNITISQKQAWPNPGENPRKVRRRFDRTLGGRGNRRKFKEEAVQQPGPTKKPSARPRRDDIGVGPATMSKKGVTKDPTLHVKNQKGGIKEKRNITSRTENPFLRSRNPKTGRLPNRRGLGPEKRKNDHLESKKKSRQFKRLRGSRKGQTAKGEKMGSNP